MLKVQKVSLNHLSTGLFVPESDTTSCSHTMRTTVCLANFSRSIFRAISYDNSQTAIFGDIARPKIADS